MFCVFFSYISNLSSEWEKYYKRKSVRTMNIKKDFDIKINIKICSVRGYPYFMTSAYGFFFILPIFFIMYIRLALMSQIQNVGECTPWIVFLCSKLEEKIKIPQKNWNETTARKTSIFRNSVFFGINSHDMVIYSKKLNFCEFFQNFWSKCALSLLFMYFLAHDNFKSSK